MSLIIYSRRIAWRKQGAAVVGTLTLTDGRKGNVVLVGARTNPKGAALVLPGESGEAPMTVMLKDGLDRMYPQQMLELLCMQERSFGTAGLPAPTGLDAP
ncbi:MAG: hypothetical protein ACLFTT_08210 [Candidatus Hydrogenedentota bacterium]